MSGSWDGMIQAELDAAAADEIERDAAEREQHGQQPR